MVFWIGAAIIALTAAFLTGRRLIKPAEGPRWPAAAGFALASVVAFASAVQATTASIRHADAVANAPQAGPQGNPAPAHASGGSGGDDFASLVSRLEAGLEENPEDPERWALLGRSYLALGRPADAVGAFEKALEQTSAPGAELLGEYAETLVAADDGLIAKRAEAVFAQILTMDPADPRARYYLALAQAEKGDVPGARASLEAMLRSAPADAPWRDTVFEQLQELGAQPEPPPNAVAAPPDQTQRGPTAEDVAAAEEMTPEDRAEMIRGMVDRLAGRMAENPDDFQGWLRLANAYMVLQEPAKAADALDGALKLQPGNVGLLIQYAEVRIAAKKGEIDEVALKALNRANDRQSGNPQVLWRLGQAAAASGDKEAARAMWNEIMPKLLTADPLKAEVQKALDSL